MPSDSQQASFGGYEAVADRLRSIWSELLNVEQVHDRDHFVGLGGDSIAATQCVTRVRELFGVDVHVTALLLDDVDFSTLVDEVRGQMAKGAMRIVADRT